MYLEGLSSDESVTHPRRSERGTPPAGQAPAGDVVEQMKVPGGREALAGSRAAAGGMFGDLGGLGQLGVKTRRLHAVK